MKSTLDHQVSIKYINGKPYTTLANGLGVEYISDVTHMGMSGFKIGSRIAIGAMNFFMRTRNLIKFSEIQFNRVVKCQHGLKSLIRTTRTVPQTPFPVVMGLPQWTFAKHDTERRELTGFNMPIRSLLCRKRPKIIPKGSSIRVYPKR